MQRTAQNRTFDDAYDYYADDAEAVVYLLLESLRFNKNCLYVMRRKDAVKFCSSEKTKGHGLGGHWCYAFTTYRRDWRETPNDFREDDGRFAPLLSELGIVPIWTKGQPVPPFQAQPENGRMQVLKDVEPMQLSLLNFAQAEGQNAAHY